MSIDRATWTDLGSAWDGYKETVGRWLAAASSGADAEEVDALVHEVLHAHSDWHSRLSQVIEATHHH